MANYHYIVATDGVRPSDTNISWAFFYQCKLLCLGGRSLRKFLA